MWEVVNTVLENSSKVLTDLETYQGASEEIRVVGEYLLLFLCVVLKLLRNSNFKKLSKT